MYQSSEEASALYEPPCNKNGYPLSIFSSPSPTYDYNDKVTESISQLEDELESGLVFERIKIHPCKISKSSLSQLLHSKALLPQCTIENEETDVEVEVNDGNSIPIFTAERRETLGCSIDREVLVKNGRYLISHDRWKS
jgi:hypothetical protein